MKDLWNSSILFTNLLNKDPSIIILSVLDAGITKKSRLNIKKGEMTDLDLSRL